MSGADPVASIDLDALAANLDALRPGRQDLIDLRRDAWGHGLSVIGPFVTARTQAAVLIDRDADWTAPGRTRTEGVPSIASDALFGLVGDTVPVMALHGTVIGVKLLRAGEGVSYGYRYRAPVDSRVALVSGGYGQGVVRALGDGVAISIDGEVHPIRGRVAMDVCVVDIGDHPIEPGARARFFGAPGELMRWGEATGLSVGELVCAVGLHTRREYLR